MKTRVKLLINLVLMVIWVLINGDFTFTNFVFGFLLSYFILWVISRSEKSSERKYFILIPRIIKFVLFFFKELIMANLSVAYEVITPHYNMNPGIVAVPLDIKTDFQIMLLANMISLTPGTFSMDVSSDRKYLYVHAMYIKSKKDFIREIKNGFERQILEISK